MMRKIYRVYSRVSLLKIIKTANIKIENPDLIRMFNETTISNAPLAVGYRAKIYLGQWALHYESIDTSVNWEYKQVNRNVYDNRGEIAYIHFAISKKHKRRLKAI